MGAAGSQQRRPCLASPLLAVDPNSVLRFVLTRPACTPPRAIHARSRRARRALTAAQPHRLRLQAPPVLVTNWRKAATPFSDSYSLEGWAGAPLPADLSDSSAQRDVSVAIDEHVEIVFVAQVALCNSPRPLCPPLCACIQSCASGAPSTCRVCARVHQWRMRLLQTRMHDTGVCPVMTYFLRRRETCCAVCGEHVLACR